MITMMIMMQLEHYVGLLRALIFVGLAWGANGMARLLAKTFTTDHARWVSTLRYGLRYRPAPLHAAHIPASPVLKKTN